jgi:hypothetical protein
MLQSTTRTQLDQLKVPYQDLKRFRKKRFGFRNRGCRRRYGITKKKKLVLAETELQQLTIKVNFEDLEKKRKPADFN